MMLEVTQEDIDNANRDLRVGCSCCTHCTHCPIGQAFKRKTGKWYKVYLSSYGPNSGYVYHSTTRPMLKFIKAFDAKQPVAPQRFRVKV